jgi:hypothetical protein
MTIIEIRPYRNGWQVYEGFILALSLSPPRYAVLLTIAHAIQYERGMSRTFLYIIGVIFVIVIVLKLLGLF